MTLRNAEGQSLSVRAGLACGIAAPTLYFLSQAVAAPFYSGYDWTRQLASELGTGGGPASLIFNAGMVLTGCATIFAAFGFFTAVQGFASRTIDAAAVALSLISSGGATLWAGLNPLPSPVHNPGLWGVGTLIAPLTLLWALRHEVWRGPVRVYLASTSMLAVAALMFTEAHVAPAGIVQRIAALFVYPPIAVIAWLLIERRRQYK